MGGYVPSSSILSISLCTALKTSEAPAYLPANHPQAKTSAFFSSIPNSSTSLFIQSPGPLDLAKDVLTSPAISSALYLDMPSRS
jgi:hypothetical protein